MKQDNERIKALFAELYDLAEKIWPPKTSNTRHCAKCKKSYGIDYEQAKYEVSFCLKCGDALEDVVRPKEYHWPHIHRLHAMISYRGSGSKNKDWNKVVDATERQFISMDRY